MERKGKTGRCGGGINGYSMSGNAAVTSSQEFETADTDEEIEEYDNY